MIGTKTVTSLLFVVVAAILGWFIGLSPSRLATLGPSEAFWAGLFAFVTGSLAHRFWKLHRPSEYYFRWSGDSAWVDELHFVGTDERRISIGKNSGEAFDFGPKTQFAIYVALAFWTGLITLDGRAFKLLVSTPQKIAEPGSEFCPEREMEKPKTVQEMDPGCVLIKRAFELGYAKSSGPCAAKQREEEQRIELCTLRQRDEPFLHYAWRRIDGFVKTLREQAAKQDVPLEVRAQHLEELYDASGFTIAGAPRASHHIFTNLPDPHPFVSDAIEKRDCAEKFRRMPHRIRPTGDTAASEHLEHVLAQLLFDVRYARAAGACREYTIHWEAPHDACARLVSAPEEFLADQGALEGVTAVLRRYQVTTKLQNVAETAGGMSSLSSILRAVKPQRFVSFHCYVEEDRTEVASSSRALSLEDYSFLASEVRVPKIASEQTIVERYHPVASMLVPTFHYGSLHSNASTTDLLEAGVDAKFFAGPQGFLSRLDFLTDVDVFLGNPWIKEREDLLDVYPWHVHLSNYVELFRARYRAERGRL